MHAYLIMAHHRPDLLRELLDALDDPRNDIFLHIDKASPCPEELKALRVQYARLTHVRSMQVNWGGYSQVKCEMRLLQAAVRAGEHDYYHLLTGVSYPLRSQDWLHDFFEHYAGTDFIAYDHCFQRHRVADFHLFTEIGRVEETPLVAWKNRRNKQILDWQHKKGIDCFNKFGMEFKKGLAYWSITQQLASYIVDHRRLVRRMMRHSVLGDEVFVHILAWNSPYRNNAFRFAENSAGSLVATTWPHEDAGIYRPGHNFTMEDLDYLLTTDNIYALKFQGPDGPELIRRIKQMIAEKSWPQQLPQPDPRP